MEFSAVSWSLLYPVAAGVSTLWSVLAVVALARVRRRRSSVTATSSRERVSVLKPLCGVDPSLEVNLRSFFAQDHSDYELVFGVQDPSDAALAIARKL